LQQAKTYDGNIAAFDSTKCDAAGEMQLQHQLLAYIGYGATLLTSNYTIKLEATYQFVYPEDNQIMGASFNTNVSGHNDSMVNLTYRPNFPISDTSSGDQINAIGDASGGTTAALTVFAAQSYGTTAAKMLANTGQWKQSVDSVLGAGSIMMTLANRVHKAFIICRRQRTQLMQVIISSKAYHDRHGCISYAF